MTKWRDLLLPALIVRRLSGEVNDLKRRYEAKGGAFDDNLLEFVYPLRVPSPRLTGTQRKLLNSLNNSLVAVLQEGSLPSYLETSCTQLLEGLILAGFGAIDIPSSGRARCRRRNRPLAAESRAGGVNLIIATVAAEFRRRFGKPHWDDVRTLLCFIAPAEFPPSTSSETLRKRAKSVSVKRIRLTLARYFP